eukprot:8857458-Pyramimonas_sp.AAC.1
MIVACSLTGFSSCKSHTNNTRSPPSISHQAFRKHHTQHKTTSTEYYHTSLRSRQRLCSRRTPKTRASLPFSIEHPASALHYLGVFPLTPTCPPFCFPSFQVRTPETRVLTVIGAKE